MTNWAKKHPEGGGSNGRKRSRNPRMSSTKGANQGRPAKSLVACDTCPWVHGEPVVTTVGASSRKAVCKAGHVTLCRN